MRFTIISGKRKKKENNNNNNNKDDNDNDNDTDNNTLEQNNIIMMVTHGNRAKQNKYVAGKKLGTLAWEALLNIA